MDFTAFMKTPNNDETREVKLQRFEQPFVIKTITNSENNRLREECTTYTKDRNGIRKPSVDSTMYQRKLIVSAVVTPDLQNSELQEYYHTAPSAEDTLDAMLLAGEFLTLQQAVLEFSGFNEDIEDLKDEVKNS